MHGNNVVTKDDTENAGSQEHLKIDADSIMLDDISISESIQLPNEPKQYDGFLNNTVRSAHAVIPFHTNDGATSTDATVTSTSSSSTTPLIDGASTDPNPQSTPQRTDHLTPGKSEKPCDLGQDAQPTTFHDDGIGAMKEDADASMGKHAAIREKNPNKRLLIMFLCCFCLLIALYALVAFYFSEHAYPNSRINESSISLLDQDGLEGAIESIVDDYSFVIEGQGLYLDVDSDDIGMHIDSDSLSDQILKRQNPILWIAEIFNNHDYSDDLSRALEINDLDDHIIAAVDDVNLSATVPSDAYIRYQPDLAAFEIVNEVPGSILDPGSVIAKSETCIRSFGDRVVLNKDSLIEPKILSTDPSLVAACGKANAMTSTNLSIKMAGQDILKLDPSIIAPWIQVSENQEVSLDQESISQWTNSVAKQFNTIGRTRTYTRPDGKSVTVSGGTYGFSIDSQSLAEQIDNALIAGDVLTIDIPNPNGSSVGYDPSLGRDWGNRYVDVDIAEQYARFYDDSGALVWESPIVSGAYRKNDTPTGVYYLNGKSTNMMLRGPMQNGVYAWESHVNYWMPFKGSSFGLHDASWQSAFGGTRYMDGYGSHGCVNLPSSAAANLYSMLNVGDVIVVHY